MMLTNATLSALINVVLLAGIPFLVYCVYQVRKHNRRAREVAARTGLCLGEPRYLLYSLAAAAIVVAAIIIFPPPLGPLTRDGSSWQSFVGLGFSGTSLAMALLYGVVKTGFAEEFLFRGLIAGSLSRRLPPIWANMLQAVIFLLPHLLLLAIAPEVWALMPLIFVGALFVGWLRIKSGSIAGPWLLHAVINVTMGLSVAIRSAA